MEHIDKSAILILRNTFTDYPLNKHNYDREYEMLVDMRKACIGSVIVISLLV